MKQVVKPHINNLKAITHNDPRAWDDLYESYAPVMYGCILKLTGNEYIAGRLFKKAFLGLRKIHLPVEDINTCFFLWKYAGKIALDYLKKNNLSFPGKGISVDPQYPILEMLCLHDQSIAHTAKTLSIPESQLKENLRTNLQ